MRMEENRKKKKTGIRFMIFVMVIVAIAVFSVPAFKVLGLKSEASERDAVLDEKEATKERLERELAVTTEPQFIETQARDALLMIKPGETMYVFDTAESADAPPEEETGSEE